MSGIDEFLVRRSRSIPQSPGSKVARPVLTGESSKTLCSAQKIQKILTCGLCKCELRYPTVCLNCNLLMYACEDCYKKETSSPDCSIDESDNESLVLCPWMKNIIDAGNLCSKSTERDKLIETRRKAETQLEETRKSVNEYKSLVSIAKQRLEPLLESSKRLDWNVNKMKKYVNFMQKLNDIAGPAHKSPTKK